MRSYYYSDGEETFGPFSFDELRETNLTPETLIWFEGLEEWIPAGTIPELAELFAQQQPMPQTPQPQTIQYDQHVDTMQGSPVAKKKSYLVPLLLIGAAFILIAALAALVITDVVKLPSLPGAKTEIVTGDPETDFLKLLENRQAFASLAIETAEDGLISKKEINKLAGVYAEILEIMAAYSQNKNKKDLFDAFYDGRHSVAAIEAERNFEESLSFLSYCTGYDDFLKRMEQVLNHSGLNISDF